MHIEVIFMDDQFHLRHNLDLASPSPLSVTKLSGAPGECNKIGPLHRLPLKLCTQKCHSH